MAGRTDFGRKLVRILCVLALVFLGLSHKMPLVEIQGDSLFLAASVTLPDGSVADLCLPAGKSPLKVSYPDCDACRLSASVVLPTPPGIAIHALPLEEASRLWPASLAPVAPFGQIPPARGPPAPSALA